MKKKNLYCLMFVMFFSIVISVSEKHVCAASNTYLEYGAQWVSNECMTATVCKMAYSSKYACAVVFEYNSAGVAIGSNAKYQTEQGTTAIARVSKSGVASAKVVNYLSSSSGGLGTSYGYESHNIDKGEFIF